MTNMYTALTGKEVELIRDQLESHIHVYSCVGPWAVREMRGMTEVGAFSITVHDTEVLELSATNCYKYRLTVNIARYGRTILSGAEFLCGFDASRYDWAAHEARRLNREMQRQAENNKQHEVEMEALLGADFEDLFC